MYLNNHRCDEKYTYSNESGALRNASIISYLSILFVWKIITINDWPVDRKVRTVIRNSPLKHRVTKKHSVSLTTYISIHYWELVAV